MVQGYWPSMWSPGMRSCLSRGSTDNMPSIMIISCVFSLNPICPFASFKKSFRPEVTQAVTTTGYTNLTLKSKIHHYNCNTTMKTSNTQSTIWLLIDREVAAISTKGHIFYSKVFMYMFQITNHVIYIWGLNLSSVYCLYGISLYGFPPSIPVSSYCHKNDAK